MRNEKQPERFTRWGRRPETAKPVEAVIHALPIAKSEAPGLSLIQTRSFGNAAKPVSDRMISGVCVPYNVLTADLGGFKEMYATGSFGATLQNENQLLTLNDNSDVIFGSRKSGTVQFWEERDGIHFQCEMPETGPGNDTLTLMRRGDISNAGALFYILQHRFETINGERVRVVTKGQLLAACVTGSSTMKGAMADVDQAIKNAAAAAHAAGVQEGIRRARVKASKSA